MSGASVVRRTAEEKQEEVMMSGSMSFGTVPGLRRAELGLSASPTLDSWQKGPDNRWVFRHIEQMLPSARVAHEPVAPSPSVGLGALAGVERLEQRLEQSYTDAIVVERGGRVIAEHYAPGFEPGQTHLLMSVSKSLCAIVVGALIDDGLVDAQARLDRYIPALALSAYGDATIEQLLDMTAAADYSEEYTDPSSEVQLQDRAAGWRTSRPGDPADTYEFLTRLQRSRPHGEVFQYCSAATDALGWLVEAVTGRRYAEVLSERLWSRLGAEQEARIAIDRGGCAVANAGISCTARDLAKVGRLMLGGGAIDGYRVVSEAWVASTMGGGDPAKWQSVKRAIHPNGSYRNQWWATGNERGNVYAAGIHGQYIWLDPVADTVIVKYSTSPSPVTLDEARLHSDLFIEIAEAVERG